jgi:hypothetical protein
MAAASRSWTWAHDEHTYWTGWGGEREEKFAYLRMLAQHPRPRTTEGETEEEANQIDINGESRENKIGKRERSKRHGRQRVGL